MTLPFADSPRVRVRLLALLITLLVLAMAAVSVHTVRSDSSLHMKAHCEANTLPLARLDMMAKGLAHLRLALAQATLRGDRAEAALALQEVQASMQLVDRTWDDYMSHSAHLASPALVQAFAVSRARFWSEGVTPAVDALRAGDLRKARRLTGGQADAMFAPVAQGLAALVDAHGDMARASHAATVTQQTSWRTRATGVVLAVLALVYAGMLLLLRGLGRSPAQAQQAATVPDAATVQAAPPALAQAGTSGTWDGVERRGPHRARNVTRPRFGARQAPQPDHEATTVEPSPDVATGTDGKR